MTEFFGAALGLIGTLVGFGIHGFFNFLKRGKKIQGLALPVPLSLKTYHWQTVIFTVAFAVMGWSGWSKGDFLTAWIFMTAGAEFLIFRFLVQRQRRGYAVLYERVLVIDFLEIPLGELEILGTSPDGIDVQYKNKKFTLSSDSLPILEKAQSREKFHQNNWK